MKNMKKALKLKKKIPKIESSTNVTKSVSKQNLKMKYARFDLNEGKI